MIRLPRRVAWTALLIGSAGVAGIGWWVLTLDPSPHTVRNRVFEALGGAGAFNDVVVLTNIDQTGRRTLTFDRQGRFVFRRVFPDFGAVLAFGHDGSETWERIADGTSRRLGRGEAERARVLMWIRTGYWADPLSPVTVSSSDASTSDCVALSIQHRGADFTQGTLFISRADWRPVRFEYEDYGLQTTHVFDDYRVVQGLSVPLTTGVYHSLDDVTSRTYRAVESSGAIPLFHRPPDERNVDYDPLANKSLEVISHRMKLYVKPKVNGQDVGWFLFDSGASQSAVSTAALQVLDLPLLHEGASRGVGNGVSRGSLHWAKSLQLGMVALRELPMAATSLPMPPLPGGQKVGGLIGADLLRNCVVEYDLVNARIQLHDPFVFELPWGAWQPLTDYGESPTLWAEFNSYRGHFVVDTGATEMLLNPLTVKEYDLLDHPSGQPFQLVSGFGGSTGAYRGVLRRLQIGEHQLADVPARFVTDSESGMADRYCDGLIGAEVLRHFRVFMDCRHHRIAFLKH